MSEPSPNDNEHSIRASVADSTSPMDLPRWVTVHSVTCAICGDYADERETIKMWPDDIDEPGVREEVESIVEEYGEGEAHIGCYTWALEG